MIEGQLVELSLWQQCLQRLRDEIPQQQFSQWISPLQVEETNEGVTLFAPNQYVLDSVNRDYLPTIESVLSSLNHGKFSQVSLVVGAKRSNSPAPSSRSNVTELKEHVRSENRSSEDPNYTTVI